MAVIVDLNADVGEGLADDEVLPYVTSANVACGLHAGDPKTMDDTVALALARGVRVGAHPGYPDRQNFGRVAMSLPVDLVEDFVLYQIAALDGFVQSRGGAMSHVKPHGALYHAGAEFPDVARAIAEAVRRYRSTLVLVGLAGSLLPAAGRDAGLRVAEEGFADRRYEPDGSLVARGEPGALLTDPDEAARQAVSLARDGCAVATNGSRVAVRIDTLCLHGDTPGAAAIARRVRDALVGAGIEVVPFDSEYGDRALSSARA